MKVDNDLYFSPRFKFSDLDWGNKENLIFAFHDRVHGFYLEPTFILLEQGHAFAAGVLLVTTVDFLAKIQIGGNTGSRIEQWLESNIAEFSKTDPARPSNTLAKRFYNEFRNGLVHEGRIKNGGQFSFESDNLVAVMDNSVMVVNPEYLFRAVVASFESYEQSLGDEFAFHRFRRSLIENFWKDVEIAHEHR